ncbi:SDR family NAD(P)-dependent oxidoreductase [Paenibacillus sp. FSL H8-0537]|uniref:SDR family NAD(P)-dependent oxidoreductase n=1 Tax=Paenibacillus sp. FSL H8-0537 TaxID=2921399 RepID=UPI003100D538
MIRYLGTRAGDIITVYPHKHPSIVKQIRKEFVSDDATLLRVWAEGSREREELDELLCRLLGAHLRELGLHPVKNPARGFLTDLYNKWYEESLALLTRYAHLSFDESSETLWQEWEARKSRWLEKAELKAQVVLVETTMRALPDILTGKRAATDILFPDASMKLVEGVYKINAISDGYNEVLADTVVLYLQERLKNEPAARIRILEIGAGTGGTSAMVFDKLQPYQQHVEEYCYTDISKAFLLHAEREYAPKAPYLTYRVFNVEEPIAGQGLDAGAYDLVLATNCLHATKNIRQTLRNAKAVLAKNGLLLLNEMSRNSVFTHLTFGLLDGWWRYEDAELRMPGCPGLSPETWSSVLKTEGFRAVDHPAQKAHDLGQQIIVAESDGVVRQKQGQGQTVASTAAKSPKTETPVVSREAGEAPASEVTEALIEERVKKAIKDQLFSSLKVDRERIDSDKSFADYGLDSITGVHLVQALNDKLPIGLKTTNLFDYSSVNQLASYILRQYKEALATAFAPAKPQTSATTSATAIANDPAIANTIASAAKLVQTARAQADVQQGARESAREGGRVDGRDDAGKKISEQGGDFNAIAIVGMSGRFSKSGDLGELWEHLANGDDLVGPVTRWDLRSYHAEGARFCNEGGFLDDIDRFDPLFFHISGVEATYMDPQQRIFLEESWKALELAGYAGDAVKGASCGVYVGINGGDYQQSMVEQAPAQSMWGNAASVIPARISYFLDLQGPAVAVDTACSSSLVSIHLACQGLRSGETDMALAGGVFIQSTPRFYLTAERASMLSATGRCHTFDDQANGFVPGEGVGVVVLKRLKDALADRDHIYGVIRGSALNQDGTTNGITAPSANSQERLERKVYETHGIDPEQIQLVEAHGTGTKLGDPIEFDALTRAFRAYTDRKEYCAIGSIKTNIGHAAAAAGVAGVLKILLALEHKQLPPSLHFDAWNADIEHQGSPFYVNTKLRDWSIEPGSKRRAAISAFGFSGTNAHMVIEEPPQTVQTPIDRAGHLIVLSARTAEQLRKQVQNLIAFCEQEPNADCGNISYTLLVGRKHLSHRLACVVRDVPELVKSLQKWRETGKVAGVHHGELLENELREQPSLKRYGNQCIENCRHAAQGADLLEQLAAVADLYAQGYALEYGRLFEGLPYARIPLPTYPFAKERYWKPEGSAQSVAKAGGTNSRMLHPLLHENISVLEEQRYASVFTGKEFFLADHVINGQRILPGVAHLEMVRAALELAAGASEEGSAWRLQHVGFASPILAGNWPVEVQVGLRAEEGEEISFEVRDGRGAVVHSQGRARRLGKADAPAVDLATLQTACSQNRISASELYELFRQAGLDYGPAHQGIESLSIGTGQVLAKLSLPDCVADIESRYVLHPSLMDAALQAAIGLMLGTASFKPLVPFAFEEVEIYGPCTPSMWAVVRRSEGSRAEDKVQKFDVDACDENGQVRVRLKGYTSRVLEEGAGGRTQGAHLLQPSWKQQGIAQKTALPALSQHLVLLCELTAPLVLGGQVVALQSDRQDIAERYQAYAVRVFEEIQTLLRSKPQGKALVQVVVPADGEGQVFSGLAGLLRSARRENPNLTAQLIEVEDTAGLELKLLENRHSLQDDRIRYRYGQRWVASWDVAEVSQQALHIPWRDGGVYLLTGGAGGLGLIFAKEIASQVKAPRLILTGRSPLGLQQQAALRELKDLGAHIEYQQVDVTREEAVAGLFEEIRAHYGTLQGILHGAGVIRDNFIIRKTGQEMQEVLAPKVSGLVHLDRSSIGLPLDFFVLFSAVAGCLGNPGQADYAAANGFLDAYAAERNRLVARGQRQGRTLAIDWPLWQDGGMQVDAETEQWMREHTGMIPLESRNGIRALYQGLAIGCDQLMVVQGDLARITEKLHPLFPAPAARPVHSVAGQVQARVLQLASDLLQVRPDELDAEAEWLDYGIDAFLMNELADRLNEEFGLDLTPSTFSELPTIQQVIDLLTGETNKQVPAAPIPTAKEEAVLASAAADFFKKQLSSVLGVPAESIEASRPLEVYGIDSIMVMQLTRQLEKTFGALPKTLFFEYQNIRDLTGYFLKNHRAHLIDLLGVEERLAEPASVSVAAPVRKVVAPVRAAVKEPTKQSGALDIAIIGLSGRYPQAHDLEAFWNNLREGRDSITEIPKERWDHSPYYDTDRSKRGKTYSKWGGFMRDVDKFDPLFFNIAPREAEIMDPQERLFLQSVYEAMEDAGYTRDTLVSGGESGEERNVGVYVGVMYSEYQFYGAEETLRGRPMALSGNPSSIANRVSYFFNLHGPSLAVDTMCSSSLTAIHLACQSLEQGDCELAVAGGVNLSLHPNKYLMLGQGKFASSKGRCESFGEGGDGYVPGEGVGAVLLKPLARALEDGDQIYGVIKGTAVNHGGKTNGYSVPNPNLQARVIGRAFKKAGIHPRSLSYLEAHGTGTALGDPIEIAGLMRVFQEDTTDTQFCSIGSVKSNIGHCESAAGIAGLTKVLLQMKHRQLVPSLHADVLNPNIDFGRTPFVVQRELAEWKRPLLEVDGELREVPRIAGISSFGAGGSNAHLVIEEHVPEVAPRAAARIAQNRPALLVLSAKDEQRLHEQVLRLQAAINRQVVTDETLADAVYTLQVGREVMEERLAVVATSAQDLQQKLSAYLQGHPALGAVFRGQVKGATDSSLSFAADQDMQELVTKWWESGQLAKLADLWVKGLRVEYGSLYGTERPRRLSLPTYPFARERCWAVEGPNFDEGFYEQILDEMVDEEITLEEALLKISSALIPN